MIVTGVVHYKNPCLEGNSFDPLLYLSSSSLISLIRSTLLQISISMVDIEAYSSYSMSESVVWILPFSSTEHESHPSFMKNTRYKITSVVEWGL